MLSALPFGPGRVVSPLCFAVLLALGGAAWADPKPLSKEEQAKVDEAIDKGVEFLKRSQTKSGAWKYLLYGDSFSVGQCALPAYALLESGVPVDDPVIQKAAEYIRPRILQTDRTYDLSLAILFFDRLGDPKDKKIVQSLALHLIAGQYRSGGWTYGIPLLGEKNEEPLLKCLSELSEQMKGKEQTRDKALERVTVPMALQALTVFQCANNLPWWEAEDHSFLGSTDNSNTQFAMLGLWVAQRHGIPTRPTFEIMVERFERFQLFPSGTWAYGPGWKYTRPTKSMTCVGLLGLAIGRGLKLSTPGLSPVKKDIHALRGLADLQRHIGAPSGQMNKRLDLPDLYFLWSLERVAMLYDLPTIADKEWYRWGAERLVTNQGNHGGWAKPFVKEGKGDNYGATINTAFALLFLKRSHPMKDLTPKLPFSAKELNEGIAHLRPSDTFPIRHPTTSSESPNSGR